MTDFLKRGHSSVGRAPALQAGGRRFDPVCLHHQPRTHAPLRLAQSSFFDIVYLKRSESLKFLTLHLSKAGWKERVDQGRFVVGVVPCTERAEDDNRKIVFFADKT